MAETIATSILVSLLTVAVLGYLARTWLEARLKASIEHEYKKQFELFQRELDQKQKVELVAEVLAEYIKTPYGETVPREQRTVLNKLSFQASLWLPAELAIELGKRLQNKPDAKTPFELILIARRLLIGDSSITIDDITVWGPSKETNADPILHGARR
jgi:hypothetical protein